MNVTSYRTLPGQSHACAYHERHDRCKHSKRCSFRQDNAMCDTKPQRLSADRTTQRAITKPSRLSADRTTQRAITKPSRLSADRTTQHLGTPVALYSSRRTCLSLFLSAYLPSDQRISLLISLPPYLPAYPPARVTNTPMVVSHHQQIKRPHQARLLVSLSEFPHFVLRSTLPEVR